MRGIDVTDNPVREALCPVFIISMEQARYLELIHKRGTIALNTAQTKRDAIRVSRLLEDIEKDIYSLRTSFTTADHKHQRSDQEFTRKAFDILKRI